jgi:hypothetical protein
MPGLAICIAMQAQKVENTSFISPSGEKFLRLEITIPADAKTAWGLFTNDDQLQRWIAPLAHIELKTGGYIITNYDKKKSLTDSLTSIKLPIINYLPGKQITLKVILNNNFSKSVIDESKNLQEIIQLVPIGKNKTKIISTMVGFGAGPDWDKTYTFFEKGNTWTYEQLLKLY